MVVVLDADDVIRVDGALLSVEVISQNGDRTVRSSEILPGDSTRDWPFRVPIVPRDGDFERRVLVLAQVFDAEGELLGVQRAQLSFRRNRKRMVRLFFSGDCRQQLCDEATTCIDGACESACVTPTRREDDPRQAGPCVREMDGGLDAGTDASDAGVDAAEDAGMDAAVDPCGLGVFAEDFETIEMLDRCGEGPCETSPAGRVEFTENGSVLAPSVDAPCGERMLRLVRFSSETGAAAAYYVAPATFDDGIFLRAWLWLDRGDGEATSILSLSSGGRRARNREGVEFRWTPSGSELLVRATGGERMTPLMNPVQPGRWTCVELGVDEEGMIHVGVDGARETFPGGALVDVMRSDMTHARIGLNQVAATGTNGTAWVDQLSVDSEPLQCP